MNTIPPKIHSFSPNQVQERGWFDAFKPHHCPLKSAKAAQVQLLRNPSGVTEVPTMINPIRHKRFIRFAVTPVSYKHNIRSDPSREDSFYSSSPVWFCL